MPRGRTGSITVICGSMYAGKTEELIRRARRALFARRAVQVFKPAIDDRFHEAMVVTHMGVRHEAQPVSGVPALESAARVETELILVEEAQFFDGAIVDLVERWADAGHDVVLAGLDQDFRRRPFGPMPELLAIADEVVKLRAICMKCGAPASHTQRLIEAEPAHEDDPLILIGAAETYEARCRRCHVVRRGRRKRG